MPARMAALAMAAAALAGGCGMTVHVEPPSAAPFDLPVDCGPIVDRTDCLVAVEVFEIAYSIPAGSRAVLSGAGDTPMIAIHEPSGRSVTATLYRDPLGRWSVLDLQSPR